jgi:arsenate reductase
MFQGALDRIREPLRDFFYKDVNEATDSFQAHGKLKRQKHTQYRILFIDSANTSRSIMAQAFAAVYGFHAESAGTFPGMKVRPEAVHAMKEVGLDIGNYRPRPLDVNRIESFDKVVVFGNVLGKPWTNRDNVESWTALDPQNLPIHAYRDLREDLEKRVSRLAKKQGIKKAELVVIE